MEIRNPPQWGWGALTQAVQSIGSTTDEEYWNERRILTAPPAVRRIGIQDLREVLARGLDDFMANRTDILFLCLIYPLLGIVLARLASGYDFLPLVFPLASGFALIGPLAGVGLNEMSRRREAFGQTRWVDVFAVLRSPSIGAIALMGLLLVGIFVLWNVAAEVIYLLTLGGNPADTVGGFIHDVFTTGAGWAMIVVGCGIGFLFALLVLSISVVSFPLLLDHDTGVNVAVSTSLSVMRANPWVMAVWGAIIAGGLVIGSIPALLGLAVVLPVLGHATWHLYRRVVEA
jgi:uncharacterized membrane protein